MKMFDEKVEFVRNMVCLQKRLKDERATKRGRRERTID